MKLRFWGIYIHGMNGVVWSGYLGLWWCNEVNAGVKDLVSKGLFVTN